MSGEKRLAQAFLLSDFIRELAMLNIKSQIGPKATKKQILVLLPPHVDPPQTKFLD